MKKRSTHRDYPRTARLNTLLQEIIAEEIDRIDDERLERVCITEVNVDSDLGRAVAYYDLGADDDESAEAVASAFAELRPRLQGAVARQTRLKRTPELRFEVDAVIHEALRIESMLASLADEPPIPPVAADDATEPGDDADGDGEP